MKKSEKYLFLFEHFLLKSIALKLKKNTFKQQTHRKQTNMQSIEKNKQMCREYRDKQTNMQRV